MSETLLQTKLSVPPVRPNLVSRPHLVECLAQAPQEGCRLTLLSAPAGFGKSTPVSEWVAGCRRLAAWSSLYQSDNDPSRFWTHFIAALQTIDPDMGAAVMGVLQSPQPSPAELFITSVINEVAERNIGFILFLDDYHLIELEQIHNALTFLLDHLPPQMHLAITSRSDPPLPLTRLRGRGRLTQMRAAELRFSNTPVS